MCGSRSVDAIQPGIHDTSCARCPSANDFSCGFHWPLSPGTRSSSRRVLAISSLNSLSGIAGLVIGYLPGRPAVAAPPVLAERATRRYSLPMLDRLRGALADRYTMERELGRGGMASVWLARDLRHDRPVAIKVLHPELAGAIGVDRFLREIRLTARLQHPNVIPVLDSGTLAGPD